MKIPRLLLLSLAAGTLLPVTSLLAQTAAPTATPSVSAPAAAAPTADDEEEKGSKREMDRYKALTPEEQSKLRAANKAAKKDPAVIAARADRKNNPKAFREAHQAAMIKAEPSVGPIIEKMKAARRAERKGQ